MYPEYSSQFLRGIGIQVCAESVGMHVNNYRCFTRDGESAWLILNLLSQ